MNPPNCEAITDQDLGRCREILAHWNRAHAPLAVFRECDLMWTLSQQSWLQYRPTDLAGTSAIVGTTTKAGVTVGLPEGNLWISLWKPPVAGRENLFVDAAMELARSAGKSKVIFGGDEFHFVPGVPYDTANGEALVRALKDSGFNGAESADFVGPMKAPGAQDVISSATAKASAEGWSFRQVETEDEKNSLDAFLKSEFPGRWQREFTFWRSATDTHRAFWMTLHRAGGPVVGFARMALRNRFSPLESGWTPAALRAPLHSSEPQWRARDACLGPIGMAKSLRGQGAGKVLLGLVLRQLLDLDAEHVCIDWTDAFKYYESLKFERVRRHWTAWKQVPR